MAEVKGLAAVKILTQEDVIKEFADANNPIPVQILSRLGFILNKDDDFAIKKEYREMGDTAGGAMLRNRLIQRYTDQPEMFTMKQFIDVLDHFETNVTLRNLLCSKCDYVAPTEASQLDFKMINNIKASLRNKCENVRQAWGKLLDETSLKKCFVEPEILEEEYNEDGEKRTKATGKCVSNYKELFQIDTLSDRIIIEGDPGMGKTTYINKIALDWTWDEGNKYYSDNTQFLQTKFTYVFLIPLRTLNGGVASTFAQAASLQLRKSGPWLSYKYASNPSESLLILDAFDEYDGSCDEINDIIDGTLFPRLNVIITTRPCHLEKLQIKNQWLSITGLTTPEKRERFLNKQGWDKKLQERDLVINALASLSTFWQTPLYLAMLCVLYKAKQITEFDPKNPNCFYILVKLFTDHIMSRKGREGKLKEEGPQLSKNQRLKIKSYIQKCAIQQFSRSNHWMADLLESSTTSTDSEGLGDLALKFGLITVEEEFSPVTGESIEVVSFVHQLFLEYYAAVEFGTIFSSSSNKKHLSKIIKKNLDPSTSPFSYFLAAESKQYKEILVKEQKCERGRHINIGKFPWLPEIQISKDIFKFVPLDALKTLEFSCGDRSSKSFWDMVHMGELCSIAKPRKVKIDRAVLGYHDQSLDYILSLVDELDLWNCNCEHINLEKQYANITSFVCSSTARSKQNVMVMIKHFPNLLRLDLHSINITNESIRLFCNSLKNMSQLQSLELHNCFTSPQSVQHVNELAKTVETSSLCQYLSVLDLSFSILDTETELRNDILIGAISKCVQLKKLNLSNCFNGHQSVQDIIQLAENIENSSLCQTLKELNLSWNIVDTVTESSGDVLMKAISKCVRLERLDLSFSLLRGHSLDILKEILQNSPHLRKNLKSLRLYDLELVPPHRARKRYMDRWKSDMKLILPGCFF